MEPGSPPNTLEWATYAVVVSAKILWALLPDRARWPPSRSDTLLLAGSLTFAPIFFAIVLPDLLPVAWWTGILAGLGILVAGHTAVLWSARGHWSELIAELRDDATPRQRIMAALWLSSLLALPAALVIGATGALRPALGVGTAVGCLLIRACLGLHGPFAAPLHSSSSARPTPRWEKSSR
jgi:hypothetical protein